MIHGISTGRPGATRFSLRGTVLKHVTHTTGWWIFKETFYGIQIQLDEKLLKLCEKQFGKIYNVDGFEASIAGVVSVFFPQEDIEDKGFAPGTNVGITFAKSGPLEQFFKGSEMVMVVDVVKIKDGVRLENEPLLSSFLSYDRPHQILTTGLNSCCFSICDPSGAVLEYCSREYKGI